MLVLDTDHVTEFQKAWYSKTGFRDGTRIPGKTAQETEHKKHYRTLGSGPF